MAVLEGIGFDPDGWRLDVAPHPFAQGIAPGDTRITTRYDLHDFAGAYFGCLHEFGHGLYEASIPAAARGHAARRPGLARHARVAEPAVGEPHRPRPAVLHLGRCRGSRELLPGARAASTPTRSTARSTRSSAA